MSNQFIDRLNALKNDSQIDEVKTSSKKSKGYRGVSLKVGKSTVTVRGNGDRYFFGGSNGLTSESFRGRELPSFLRVRGQRNSAAPVLDFGQGRKVGSLNNDSASSEGILASLRNPTEEDERRFREYIAKH